MLSEIDRQEKVLSKKYLQKFKVFKVYLKNKKSTRKMKYIIVKLEKK